MLSFMKRPNIFGNQKYSRRKHAEDRRDAHHEMEVRRHDVGIVHRQIERALSEDQTGDTAGDEQRNETERKQHRVVNRILAPHNVPIQLNVLTAEGTPIESVSIENAIAE